MAELSIRARRALATRRRMVEAAYRELCHEGYAGATMNAIAQEAGVAVQTLYYTFHTKAALLGEALGGAILGFDQWPGAPAEQEIEELLPWHSWWPDFLVAATAHDALDVFVRGGVPILERVAPLLGAMHGAAGDPDAAEVVRVSEERRVQAYREAVDVIASKPPGLRPGLTRAAATDVTLALFTAEIYQTLSVGRGWSHRRCSRFLGDLLASQLLAPA